MSQNNRKFDLSLLDSEKLRKAKRKQLLKYSAPLIVIICVLSLKLASPWFLYSQFHKSYASGNYAQAAGKISVLTIFNFMEPYKVYFNRGTSQYMAQNFESARKDLTIALERAPKEKECIVRVNLVLTLVAIADQHITNKNLDEAIVVYDDAKAIIDARDCGLQLNNQTQSNQNNDAEKKLQEQRKEINEKQSNAKKQQNNDDPDSQKEQEQQADNGEQPSQEKLDKLEEQENKNNKENQRNKNRQRAQGSSESEGESEFAEKPW